MWLDSRLGVNVGCQESQGCLPSPNLVPGEWWLSAKWSCDSWGLNVDVQRTCDMVQGILKPEGLRSPGAVRTRAVRPGEKALWISELSCEEAVGEGYGPYSLLQSILV